MGSVLRLSMKGRNANNGISITNWKECGYKTPVLCETVDPDRISLTLEIEIDGNDGNRDGNDGNRDGNLTFNESLVLQALATQSDLSAAKIAAKVGLSKSTAERILRSLREKGYIRREGSTRGKWIVLK